MSRTPTSAGSTPSGIATSTSTSSSASSSLSSLSEFWKDDYQPLHHAGAAILQSLRNDESTCDADLYRRISGATNTSVTGTTGSSRQQQQQQQSQSQQQSQQPPYYDASTSVSSFSTVPIVRHLYSTPLPFVLQHELRNTTSHSFLGLLSPANLAWMSVDCKLWLWKLQNAFGGVGGPSSDEHQQQQQQQLLCQFQIPSKQSIVTVGLVKPKSGVFVPTVEWCLVITTPDQVLLCALNRQDTTAETMKGGGTMTPTNSTSTALSTLVASAATTPQYRFVPTLYTLSMEHVVVSVTGTESGRIFLGTNNGSLYEMTYEGIAGGIGVSQSETSGAAGIDEDSTSLNECLQQFYNGNERIPPVLQLNANHVVTNWQGSGAGGSNTTLQRLGKRTWNALLGKRSRDNTDGGPTRKSAKTIHRNTPGGGGGGGGILSALLPDIITNTTSRLLGNHRNIGPIVQLKVDEHRNTLYTLSSNGTITAYDLRTTPRASATQESGAATLTCSMNVSRVVRSYLEAVSRGQLSPPYGCSFSGGDTAAQAGVGGMDGARQILKAADFGRNTAPTNGGSSSTDVLKPVAIHIISPAESQRLTLSAVTAGGLRLYLSSLSREVLSSGPNQVSSSTASALAPNTLTLCHVRAPPPPSPSSAAATRTSSIWDEIRHLDASYYHMGTFVAALERKKVSNPGGLNTASTMGNLIVASSLESVFRPSAARDRGNSDDPNTRRDGVLVSGGMVETVSTPMDTTDGILPGGIVWDIAQIGMEASSVETLMLKSQTPTDAELSIGVPPAFFPSSKLRSDRRHPLGTTSYGAAAARSPASLSATALTVLGNVLTNIFTSRPVRLGIQFQNSPLQNYLYPSAGASSNYRISNRFAVDGFSSTAEELPRRASAMSRSSSLTTASTQSATARSARLRAWLLRPAAVPLNQLSTLHLASTKQMVAVNAGGLHYFGIGTILTVLADALVEAGENVATDANVSRIFQDYSYKEGCAMCLALAVGCGPASVTEHIRRQAKTAALARAFVPRLVALADSSDQMGGMVSAAPTKNEPLVPSAYTFQPSELYGGLISLVSRLLRPVWFKPAVVVTEGRLIKVPWSRATKSTPAKVELLLCEETTEMIRVPLANLLRLMQSLFARAVKTVPGGAQREDSIMEIDDENSSFFTRALEYNSHHRAAMVSSAHFLSPAEADNIARLVEEKNIHCIYRLLSRVVQLLNLLSLLRRAQNLPELNEVEWGLLHGISVAQLVQTSEGQERLEWLLNSLVTAAAADGMPLSTPSAQSDQLANLFATECYLFFSPGSRLAYLGFRHANEALACQQGSERRAALSALAADNLRNAARHWYSAPLISGRILHTKGRESVEDIAIRAMQHGSPLAKAVDVLVKLGDVANAVEVCLITTSNFKYRGANTYYDTLPEASSSPASFEWETNLYHKRQSPELADAVSKGQSQATPTQLVAYGANVTNKDAIDTCYALVFYHLSDLLKSQHPLRHNMVSACAATTDLEFLWSLFLFLLENGHKDTLFLIDSAELDSWLRNRNDPDLLRSYYDVQGRLLEAGQVSWDVACDTRVNRPLSERIEWLRRALVAYDSARQNRLAPGDGEVSQKIQVVTDILLIAQIQSRVLAAVSAAKADLSADQLEKLSFSLVVATELYNDYAAPLGLFEHCLFLLHACRHNEEGYIKYNWKGIMCEELLPCVTRNEVVMNYLQKFVSELGLHDDVRFLADNDSAGTLPLFESGLWASQLEARIVHLGKELFGSGADYVVPVDFLLMTLQGLVECAPSLEPSWPLFVLTKAGVPFLVILDAYESLLQQDGLTDLRAGGSVNRIEHAHCLVDFIDYWVRSTGNQPFGNTDPSKNELSRAMASGRLLPTLSALKTRLEPMQNNAGLSERIHDIEDRLQYFS